MKKVFRLTFLTTIWLLLIYSTYELGMWQLHRAQAMNVATAVKPDQPLIALTDVASAGMNLPIKAINRIIYADGIYSTSYIARDQKISEGKLANLDVRLLKLSSGHSVLVVRGVASEPLDVINSDIYLTGRLYPRQNMDRAFAKPGELSRIDPALVVSKENPFLYDGYIVLQSEKIGGKSSSNTSFIPTPQISQQVAGFYWQHISYVVVWWFMGALLLIAPLFPQFRKPKKVLKSGVKK
ncbi:MAG: SURF1 family cytochrome oxidase biogenesis protein [Actinomycetes bacterium]